MIIFNQQLEDMGGHTIPKGIGPKVDTLARLEFELAYFKTAVQPLHSVDLPHTECRFYLLMQNYLILRCFFKEKQGEPKLFNCNVHCPIGEAYNPHR